MSLSPFVFLRATFYRWAELWPSVCSFLLDAPEVVAIGDLHIENFGTWRDSEGRLVWGINDVDEAYPLPYANDLVRLATSAMLAASERHIRVDRREVCSTILEGYRASLERGGRPIVLAERNQWLRRLALTQLHDPALFWKRLRANPPAPRPIPYGALRLLLPDPKLRLAIVRRTAGMGSLGRRRYVAISRWDGGRIAREAKALVPSAVAWTRGEPAKRFFGADLLERAVRARDPFFAITDRWIVRRLAPDCTKIELDVLPSVRGDDRLLRAMGWETANLHLASKARGLLRHLNNQPRRWLDDAVAGMAAATIKDWRVWRGR